MENFSPIAASSQLLLALKVDKPYLELSEYLAKLSMAEFTTHLNSDEAKKSFWMNIYNAYFLILRKHQKIEKSVIYNTKSIIIAGKSISLDEIEHGILRRYKVKLAQGYVTNIFALRWIKDWSLDKEDFRIHFALNCGAVSCPPIAFYSEDNIDKQLDLATASFLEVETIVDQNSKTITISKLFLWYKGDFGGERGAKKITSKYLNQDFSDYKVKYSEYDFTEDLDKFVS